jgi:hypothetical protein
MRKFKITLPLLGLSIIILTQYETATYRHWDIVNSSDNDVTITATILKTGESNSITVNAGNLVNINNSEQRGGSETIQLPDLTFSNVTIVSNEGDTLVKNFILNDNWDLIVT